jgi:hypothetical protein
MDRSHQLAAGRVHRHVLFKHLVGDRETLVHPTQLSSRPPPASPWRPARACPPPWRTPGAAPANQ